MKNNLIQFVVGTLVALALFFPNTVVQAQENETQENTEFPLIITDKKVKKFPPHAEFTPTYDSTDIYVVSVNDGHGTETEVKVSKEEYDELPLATIVTLNNDNEITSYKKPEEEEEKVKEEEKQPTEIAIETDNETEKTIQHLIITYGIAFLIASFAFLSFVLARKVKQNNK